MLEVDIKSYFDSVDRKQLQRILRQRVRDGVLLRLIGKWLRAGVMEDGHVYHPESGTPQGGVISPLLANVFLHEILDVWFTNEVQPRLRGKSVLIRFADDFVILFSREEDAHRVKALLPKRLGKYGLEVHPEKTKLVQFTRPRGRPGRDDRPGTFELLGFTHFWGLSRKGKWVVQRRTARSRFSRTCHALSDWMRNHRHDRVREQHEALSRKLKGHDAYYGITGNYNALKRLRNWAERTWRKWLSTRSRDGRLSWDRMKSHILERFPLPRARVVHSVLPRAAKP